MVTSILLPNNPILKNDTLNLKFWKLSNLFIFIMYFIKKSIAGQIYYIDLIKLNGKIFTFKIKYDPK